MKAKEIRDLTVDEIKLKLKDRKKELLDMKLKLAMKVLENPNKLRDAKREIARMLTIIKEKGANK
jgi:large subunit ribosomal protein L29